MRTLLDDIDGFISIERFDGITEPGKMLSLSFWRDEEVVRRWRQMGERDEAPTDSRALHDASMG